MPPKPAPRAPAKPTAPVLLWTTTPTTMACAMRTRNPRVSNMSARNYNDAATDDDSSCIYPMACETCSGETDGTGTTVDNDADDDSVCDADEVAGCQNATACNYNAAATDNDSSCVYTAGCETRTSETDGTGTTVDNDADDDGVCDADEIAGCQDATACNYNAATTDDDSGCVYATGCETCSGETDGTGTTVDNDADDDGVCDADEVAGCQDSSALQLQRISDRRRFVHLCHRNLRHVLRRNRQHGTVVNNGRRQWRVRCRRNPRDCPTCQPATTMTQPRMTTAAASTQWPAKHAQEKQTAQAPQWTTMPMTTACTMQTRCHGCQDATARNYNAAATDNDSSCVYPTGCRNACSGETDRPRAPQSTTMPLSMTAYATQTRSPAVRTRKPATTTRQQPTQEPATSQANTTITRDNCLNDADGNGINDEIDALLFNEDTEVEVRVCVGEDFCGEGTVWSEDFQMCVEETSCPGDLNGDLVVGTGDLLLLLMDYGFECE